MGAEIAFGVDFLIASVEASISSEYSSVIQNDATTMLSQASTQYEEKTITLGCASDGRQASLWQWVVIDSTGTSRLMTTETICRFGDGLFNTPPECPYPACTDDMCTTCQDGWYTQIISGSITESSDD